GAAARINRKGARRFTAIIRSQPASVVDSIVPVEMIPAAFTRTSIAPNCSTAVCTTRSGAASSVTSAGQDAARPPLLTIAFATSSKIEVRRPTRTTDAPSCANASAAARPMPLVAPVTTTAFPLHVMSGVYLYEESVMRRAQPVDSVFEQFVEILRQAFCLLA